MKSFHKTFSHPISLQTQKQQKTNIHKTTKTFKNNKLQIQS